MVGSNKILTVSYGTFSCTLEGFDDSFGSMKAIAEYFRDLAQEDRYFGAEPPTPDAEMLAKIAEREISRRVEAQMDDRGIHLRAAAPAAVAALNAAAEAAPAEAGAEPEPAGSSDSDDSSPATAEVAMPPMADEPVVKPLDVSDFMTAPAAEEAEAPAAPTALAGNATGIAAKLARIRAVVSEPIEVAADAEDTEEPFPVIADEAFEDEGDAAPAIEETAAFEVTAEEDVLAFEDDDAEAPAEEETAAAEDDVAEEVTAEEAAEDTEADTSEDDVAAEADEADAEDAAEPEEAVAEDTAEEELVADEATDAETTADETAEVEEEVAETADAETAEEVAAEDESSEDAAEDVTSEDVTEDAPTDDVAEDAEAAEAALELAAEDAAWATAALATSQAGADAEDILEDTTDAADDAVAEDVSAEAEDETAEVDEDLSSDLNDIDADLSSDLNDIDPVVPDIAPAVTPARIVRIRKDGPAEIVNLQDGEDEDSHVSVALKTEAEDIADDVAAEDTVAEDKSEAEETTPFALESEMLADVQDAVADATDDVEVEAEADDAVPVPAADAAHDDIRAAIAAAMPAGSLSDEDEDDLQRELAAVAEEVVVLDDEDAATSDEIIISGADVEETTVEAVADETTEDTQATDNIFDEVAETVEETVAEETEAPEAEAEPTPDTPEVVQSRPRSRRRLPDADYAVTRMIAQTDEALNEPAGSRRRNAIAQLKAAVAATEAARQLGDDENGKGEAENAFRNDLNEVVRPSKPIETDSNGERVRATPLKLVASQRVDGEPEEAIQDAPRPKSAPVTDNEYGGFAEFAASMGATELPDLLEAAAAYTSFVEGVEDFSRPQIMKKVQMTTTEEFSREDGLRSFGTLLRQGRISKVRNGRFQVSEQTRFRPDARSA